jgi:hypothetical protein
LSDWNGSRIGIASEFSRLADANVLPQTPIQPKSLWDSYNFARLIVSKTYLCGGT